jgi:tRNA(fMet)-specific endonuclease VapC
MSITFMLDTDICIYIAKHRPPEVEERFKELEVGQVGMSVITYGELFAGALKSQHWGQALDNLERIVGLIPVIEMTGDAGKCYGVIRRGLEQAGTPIGNNDLWIAAHALSLGVTVVTNNVREFGRVPDLKVENWVVS